MRARMRGRERTPFAIMCGPSWTLGGSLIWGRVECMRKRGEMCRLWTQVRWNAQVYPPTPNLHRAHPGDGPHMDRMPFQPAFHALLPAFSPPWGPATMADGSLPPNESAGSLSPWWVPGRDSPTRGGVLVHVGTLSSLGSWRGGGRVISSHLGRCARHPALPLPGRPRV